MCPPSSVCPEGSIEDIPCDQPFYYVKNEDDLSCTLTYKFYLMVCGSCFGILVLIITAFVTIKKHKNNLFKRDEINRLLLDSKDPTYHGY